MAAQHMNVTNAFELCSKVVRMLQFSMCASPQFSQKGKSKKVQRAVLPSGWVSRGLISPQFLSPGWLPGAPALGGLRSAQDLPPMPFYLKV